MGEQLRRAFEDFLDAETAGHPVLIVLEDLHWGDQATVRFLEAALRNLRERPFCVLALARPEVQERFPKLWNDRAQKLRLRPLALKACEKLVGQVLGDRVDPEMKKRIVTLADGNAFYLEELLRTAMESSLENKMGALRLPDTVLAMVHTRLESLPSEARRYLRAASIFGNTFALGGLMALLGRAISSSAFSAVLDDLVAREFVQRRDQSRFVGDIEYGFRHALIREGAYEMLTEDNRKLGHRLAGVWLEEHGESDAMVLAQHFERGDDLMRAGIAYRRAAEHALEADDLEAAIDRADRAVGCGATDEALGAVRLIQADAHNWRGELALSEERAMEAIALLTPGTTVWFRASQQAADVAGKLGVLDRVESLAQKTIGVSPAPDAMNSRTTCLCICANHLIYGGRYVAADQIIAALSDTVEVSQQSPQAVGMYYLMRAIRASASGDPCGFRDGHEIALPFFERAGDRRNACLIRHNLGFARAELGDYEGAERELRALLPIARQMSLHEVEGASLQNLGRVLMYRGMFDEGRSIQLQAIDAFAKQNHPRMKGVSHAYLADLELLAGNWEAAESEARSAIESLVDVPPLRAGALAIYARVLLAEGKTQECFDAAKEAFTLLESLGTIEEGETAVRLVYAEALVANGREVEFVAAITSAREHLLAKAERISDPAGRERFLRGVADNVRTMELAFRSNS